MPNPSPWPASVDDPAFVTARSGPADSGDVELTGALRQMLLIREVEERVLDLRAAGDIVGSVHPCIGQESAPVGIASVLDDRDRILATYRGHGWALASGVTAESLFAELLGRSTGTNGGRGGSAYLTAPETGFVGENSIVGAGLPIANGVAMALAQRGAGGVVVVSFGDGATNQGASHEAMVFAVARCLPVVFVCENNEWSEMTPIASTVPHARLFQRAAAYGMPAHEIDGSDIRAVADVAAGAIHQIRDSGGPVFLELRVPRIRGHYNGDIEHYRSAADKAEHGDRDPITRLAAHLLDTGAITPEDLAALRTSVADDVAQAITRARSAPLPDIAEVRNHVIDLGPQQTPSPLPETGKKLTYGLAANRALMTELDTRDDVVMFGEDIAIPGGTFGVTRNLRKMHGERVFDTPISEAAILGAAVGASIEGLRPVVEIMWSDFLLVAFDQVVNQAANVRYLSRGTSSAPLVIRMQQGVTPGSCAQHSQSLEALLAHIPGIKVGLPATPHDAYAMLRAAVADPDPVVIIESRAIYQQEGLVDLDAPVEPVGGARQRREGPDLLIVSWGRMANVAMDAAALLADEGIEAAVLDLRWLAPLDEKSIASALSRSSGKILVVHEANLTGGFGSEIAARVAERHFNELDAPIRRLGLPDVRVPAAPTLQAALVPSVATIAEAARELARH